MLRIHLTGSDLAGIRIATGPDPMWEIVLSLQLLQSREGAAVFDEWRRFARARLGNRVRPLFTLAPHAAYFPNILTSTADDTDVERALADGDVTAMARPGAAFRAYYAAVIQPYWTSLKAHIDADLTRRSRAFLDGGCEGLLESFRPLLTWRSPVWEAPYPVDRDLHVNGRGLLLVPAFFCWRTPVTFADAELRPVLVYPIAHDLAARLDGAEPAGRALGALIGATRATILRTLEYGCTTTELARRTGVSLASASQHATVLRESGLIVTQRLGGSVLHTLTPLGTAVLNGG